MMFIEKLLHERTKLLFWIFLILVVTLFPSEKLQEREFEIIGGADKIIHACIYGVLSWLLCLNFYKKMPYSWKNYILIIICATMFGILMEVFQYSFPALGRSFEVLDILFNFFGAVIGCGWFVLNKLKL